MSLSSSTTPRPPTTNAFLSNLRVFRYAAAANAAEKISSFSTVMPSCSNLYTYCARLLLLLLVTNTSLLPCSRSSAIDSRAPGNSVSPCQMTPSQSITMQSTSVAMRESRPSPSSRSSASAFAGSARAGDRRPVAARRRIPNSCAFAADLAPGDAQRCARPRREGAVEATAAAIVQICVEKGRVCRQSVCGRRGARGAVRGARDQSRNARSLPPPAAETNAETDTRLAPK